MIVPRIKLFSGEQQVTSRDLELEQMRRQRELLKLQKQKDMLRAAETRSRQKTAMAQQKLEAQRDEQVAKNVIKVRKNQETNAGNESLVKSRTVPVKPVEMRIH